MRKEDTNAQRDGGDIPFSSELKGKVYASTELPFDFEGRTLFHLEPKQNFKAVQPWCPFLRSHERRGVNLAGSDGCTHAVSRKTVCRAGWGH